MLQKWLIRFDERLGLSIKFCVGDVCASVGSPVPPEKHDLDSVSYLPVFSFLLGEFVEYLS